MNKEHLAHSGVYGMDRTTRLLLRESSMRPFQRLHQNDDPDEGGRRRRPSGQMTCSLCGHQYWEHPVFEDYSERCVDPDDLDHRLCDGTVVYL